MPPKKRRLRHRAEAVFSPELRMLLETGTDPLGYFAEPLSDEQLRAIWRRFRGRVMRDFAGHHRAGERPWGWWKFDAPAGRPIAPTPDGERFRNSEECEEFQLLLDRCFLTSHHLMSRAETKHIKVEAIELRRLVERPRLLPGDPSHSIAPDSSALRTNECQ